MRRISYALLAAIVCGCGSEPHVTQPTEALATARPEPDVLYHVVTFGSLGGTASQGNSIDDRGRVAGSSNFPGDDSTHATLWAGGSVRDLGTLGGANSSVAWPGQNNGGVIVGIAETAELDTLGESWSCSFFFPTGTGHTCLGFVWDDGVMTPLPTLGGQNGFATAVNSRDQVVGWAETKVVDPTCNGSQLLQFRAVMWEPKRGAMRELPPFAGDSTSAATAINDRGDVVGISGDCDIAVGRFSARRAVLWQKGRVIDLGNLGGVSWHTPMDINNRGDVVGFSNPAGDGDGSFMAHAFLWTRQDGMRDLHTLDGDGTSQALGINARGQIVGVSSGPDGSRAFLWESGSMKDLNTLVAPGSPDSLVAAQAINDAGVITGSAVEKSSGETVTFVATPITGEP